MFLVINGIIERLDRRLQEQLFTSLRTLNETAVVHVTRSAAIVQRSDYAIIIDNGAILSQGVPSELKVPEL
jgi:ABC-type branched-subunit amino acid transport system ATPase component